MSLRVIILCVVPIWICHGQISAEMSPREYFKFASFRFEKGDLDGAIEYLNRSIEIDPSYGNAFLLRAEAYFKMERYRETVTDLESAFEIEKAKNAFYSKYFLMASKAYFSLDDVRKAYEFLNSSIDAAPDNSEALQIRSEWKYKQRDYQGAIDDLDQAIYYAKNSAELYIARATLGQSIFKPKVQDEKFVSVSKDFAKAIMLEPDNYDFYKKRSAFFKDAGAIEQTISDYNTMVGLNPKDFTTYRDRGLLRMQKQEYEQAIHDFSSTLQLEPNDELGLRYRGMCFHNQRNYNRAISDFSRVIKRYHEDYQNKKLNESEVMILGELFIMRGHSYQALGYNQEACGDFSRSLEIGTKKAYNYYRKFCSPY
jgi:tetratricopeptide (TPR) repeat protein